jgi:hypothetical protein
MLVPTVMNWFDDPASSVNAVGADETGDGYYFLHGIHSEGLSQRTKRGKARRSLIYRLNG